MFSRVNSVTISVALTCIAVGLTGNSAAAVTADLARKCSALMAKAYPLREPGNPAAGRAKGDGLAAQTYYQKCLTNNGKVDDNAGAQANGPATPGNNPGTKGK